MMHQKLAYFVASFLLISSSLSRADFHTFNNSAGEEIKAELVSHKNGMVTIRREDGQKFQIDPSIFCTADQTYIKEWMQKNPASVDYKFRISGDKKQIADKKKVERWVYVITATNLSQDTASNLIFEYRVVYKPSSNRDSNSFSDGSEKLTGNLEHNKTFQITTTAVNLSGRKKADAEILGCLLRIRNSHGDIIREWVSEEDEMKDIDWNTTKPKSDKPKPGTGVIK